VSVLMAGAVAVTVGAQAAAVVGAVGCVVTAIDALLTYRTARIEAAMQIEQTLEHIEQTNQQLEQQTIEQWHRAQHRDQLQIDIGGPRRVGTVERQLKAIGVSLGGVDHDDAPKSLWHGVESSIRLGR
jgi:hypothetical protein